MNFSPAVTDLSTRMVPFAKNIMLKLKAMYANMPITDNLYVLFEVPGTIEPDFKMSVMMMTDATTGDITIAAHVTNNNRFKADMFYEEKPVIRTSWLPTLPAFPEIIPTYRFMKEMSDWLDTEPAAPMDATIISSVP